MKKIVILLFISIVGVSNAFLFKKSSDITTTILKSERKAKKNQEKSEEKFRKKLASYELEAVIKTNKGNINLFLYPEASSENVANFVNLALQGYYDGLKFNRVIPNTLVQSGYKIGDGTGNPGYSVNDEVVSWLTFDSPGILAMANSGPNTNGSQFFLTLSPLQQLNRKYTIIGELKSREDLSVLKLIRENDTVIGIEIHGKKADEFLFNFADKVAVWDAHLKENK